MPSIKPISDLKNYEEVLKEVEVSERVYLTRNGHVEYGILTMEEIDELDHVKAAYMLIQKLHEAEERAEKEGWIDADDLERELGQLQFENKIFARCKGAAKTDKKITGDRSTGGY